VKLVADAERLIEPRLPLTDLAVQLDEHRYFHGAPRVEGIIRTPQPLGFAIEGAQATATSAPLFRIVNSKAGIAPASR